VKAKLTMQKNLKLCWWKIQPNE